MYAENTVISMDHTRKTQLAGPLEESRAQQKPIRRPLGRRAQEHQSWWSQQSSTTRHKESQPYQEHMRNLSWV